MKSNKPKTIADLKINWTFEPQQKSLTSTTDSIVRLNPKYEKLKIKNGHYIFQYADWEFVISQVHIHNNSERLNTFSGFLEEIDYRFRDRIQFSQGSMFKPLTLDRFELLDEGTFKIHVKE